MFTRHFHCECVIVCCPNCQTLQQRIETFQFVAGDRQTTAFQRRRVKQFTATKMLLVLSIHKGLHITQCNTHSYALDVLYRVMVFNQIPPTQNCASKLNQRSLCKKESHSRVVRVVCRTFITVSINKKIKQMTNCAYDMRVQPSRGSVLAFSAQFPNTFHWIKFVAVALRTNRVQVNL